MRLRCWGTTRAARLLSAVAKGVQWQLRDFSPQGLSNIVWAYAKMGAAVSPEVAALLDALAAEAVSQLRDARARQCFIPQNVSNMVYGCALRTQCSPDMQVGQGKLGLGTAPKEACISVWLSDARAAHRTAAHRKLGLAQPLGRHLVLGRLPGARERQCFIPEGVQQGPKAGAQHRSCRQHARQTAGRTSRLHPRCCRQPLHAARSK